MFSTIIYSNGVLEDEETSGKHLNGDGSQKKLACLECRSRKVKCTGEKHGCQRCLGNKSTCIYPESNRRSRRKRACELICRDNDRKRCSSDSRKISSVPSPAHNPPLLPPTAPITDFPTTPDFSSGDLFANSLGFSDNFALSIDELCSTNFGEPGDYGNSTETSGIDPISTWQPTTAQNTRDTTPLEDGTVCNCAQLATQMLGGLDSMISNITDLPVDAILTDQKSALGQLNSCLVCEHCRSPPATTKVIVLVAEGLCFCLERAVADYVHQLRRGVEEDAPFSTGSCNIGGYSVNSWHEWAHILRVSLLCRCRELQAAVVCLQERDVLKFLLSESEKKLASMINRLKRCEDYL